MQPARAACCGGPARPLCPSSCPEAVCVPAAHTASIAAGGGEGRGGRAEQGGEGGLSGSLCSLAGVGGPAAALTSSYKGAAWPRLLTGCSFPSGGGDSASLRGPGSLMELGGLLWGLWMGLSRGKGWGLQSESTIWRRLVVNKNVWTCFPNQHRQAGSAWAPD